MASSKSQPVEGVALSINTKADRYAPGVAVTVPTDASDAESKSGQKANPKKEQS